MALLVIGNMMWWGRCIFYSCVIQVFCLKFWNSWIYALKTFFACVPYDNTALDLLTSLDWSVNWNRPLNLRKVLPLGSHLSLLKLSPTLNKSKYLNWLRTLALSSTHLPSHRYLARKNIHVPELRSYDTSTTNCTNPSNVFTFVPSRGAFISRLSR